MQHDLSEHFHNHTVVVTGGAGFIGSRLTKRLLSLGARVIAVDCLVPEHGGNLANLPSDETRCQLVFADVCDTQIMEDLVKGCSFLFNLAGQSSHLDSMKEPLADLRFNAQAQLSVLEACRAYNRDVRIVFASTRQLYGKPQYLPVDELHSVRPVDVNGINKLAGEWYHLLYGDVYDMAASVLRLTNTYGPGMRIKDARQTFLGTWIQRVVSGETFLVFGDGTQLRDFTYVEDAVDAFLLTAVSGTAVGKTYNLGGLEQVSLEDVARLLTDLDPTARYEIVPFPDDLRKIDIGDYYSDYSRIREDLGWEPTTPLREGLGKSLDYYREHLTAYL